MNNLKQLKDRILSLSDRAHYSGRYIKAFLLMEEDEESGMKEGKDELREETT